MSKVEIQQFGRDHWSLLLYVESRCVDASGFLQRNRMRCNSEIHPLLSAGVNWKDDYSTRVAGLQPEDSVEESFEKGTRIKGHDDWDCLDDLEAAGMVEILSLTQGVVKMTEYGYVVAASLRRHSAEGGQTAFFIPPAQRMAKAS